MISELKSVIRKYYQIEKAWRSPEKNTDEYLAATCLFEHLSYRHLEPAKRDPLIGFRVLSMTIRRILKPQHDAVTRFSATSNSLVISGTLVIQERVTEYVRRSSHSDLHSYIAKDVIPVMTSGKLLLIFSMLGFALRQAFKSIFSSSRLNLALTITEVVEIAYILDYIKQNQISLVYDFVPYEIDSNFMYLLLRDAGIHVIKIPSSGPLSTHHRIMLSDEIVFSTPYHSEEYQKFRDTFRVQNYILWPPERAFQYFPKYKTNRPAAAPHTLGFYSHGEWLRREEKHSAYGDRIREAEETILKYLGVFVKSNPEYKLLIFPHPREMRIDISTQMNAFYRDIIAHDDFEIIATSGGAALSFDKADIAIVAFSTVLYERLFCGYKTFIGNMAITEFPMNRNALNNISFHTYEGMSKLISTYSDKDEAYFFEKTGLEPYRAAHYPEP